MHIFYARKMMLIYVIFYVAKIEREDKIRMPNYQEMYGIMVRATEKAMRILIEAQQKCEELAIAEENPVLILPLSDKKNSSTGG